MLKYNEDIQIGGNAMDFVKGIKVAILVANGFEQSELTSPKEALDKEGAITKIISPEKGKVFGWKHTDWGNEFTVDIALDDANPDDFDALLLPGGVMNPDKLRLNEKAIAFIKHFIDAEKPIAAICHGPWTLINAGGVKGKTITSWPSIKLDLINAGANWVDKEVIRDGLLVTSRKPDDLPAFNREMLDLFKQEVLA